MKLQLTAAQQRRIVLHNRLQKTKKIKGGNIDRYFRILNVQDKINSQILTTYDTTRNKGSRYPSQEINITN